MSFYMAASAPPPLIPWKETAPAFSVTQLGHDGLPAGRFSLPYAVSIGGSEGCACGFKIRWGDMPPNSVLYMDASELQDRVRLLEYLRDRVSEGPVELWMCWEGDQATAPLRTVDLTIDDLASDFDQLSERTFVRLRK